MSTPMASKAASALVKAPPTAALEQEQNAPVSAPTPATPATSAAAQTTTTTTTASSAGSMKSKNSNDPIIPSMRPRRGSSDDFGASGSLGSIAGSAVGYGSSLEYSLSGGLGGIASSSHGSHPNNSLKSRLSPRASPRLSPHISPSGRRPLRKRKASVDFSLPALPMDDSDSGLSVSQLLPQHQKGKTGGAAGSSSTLTLPAPSKRNRLYSDLTMPESLANSRSRLYSDLTLPESLSNSSKNHSLASSKHQPLQNQNKQQNNEARKGTQHQQQILPSVDALPAIGDDLIDNEPSSAILLNPPASPAQNNPTVRKDRGMSLASIRTEGQGLDRLDSLGLEATISASRIRKGSSVTSDKSNKSKENPTDQSDDGTLGSQSHRFLMEAFLGDGTESLVLNPEQRERLHSFDAAAEVIGKSKGNGLKDQKDAHVSGNNNNGNVTNSRDRLSSIGGRRNRLESWGGMSDMSVGTLKADQNLDYGVGIFGGAGTHTSNNSGSGAGGAAAASNDKTAALAATIYTSLANDVTAAANPDGNDSVSSFLVSDEKVPTRISVNRERLNSIASLGDASALLRWSGIDAADAEFPSDVHSFVQAAMATVEDQLADLATAVEAVSKENKEDIESEISSTASPMIGAASDVNSNRSMDSVTGRPRSSSMSSMLQISVDYDAVAAAVDAADAAVSALDLSHFTLPPNAMGMSSSGSVGSQSKNRKKRPLPTQKKQTKKKTDKPKTPRSRTKKRGAAADSMPSAKRQATASAKKNASAKKPLVKLPDIPRSKLDDRDMEKLRERARAAAGYVPPSAMNGSVKVTALPPKKRSALPMTPSQPPRPSVATSGSNFKTPVASNTSGKYNTPGSGYSAATPASSTKGQSSQKWESMFDCLLKFIEDRRKEGTAGMTEAQRAEWAWDGNVPTTYKTKDGKALGRWVNNQRSAKSKGTLKKERETRLVDAGLKWSVLASNSWNEMLEELRTYVAEQVKQGKKWDGNVPTNYRIKVSRDKAKPFGKDDDEDKNLGRWVNRQRSMFQAGKLRKDRQLALEKIGLKWSMLATTSWESMFETLCKYVEGKKKGGNEWDGNVPANYRTEDVPPRALGRWINRQRSAYGKSKLKPEYVAKLNEIGLKWSIHERRPTYHQYARPDATPSSARKTNPTAKSVPAKTSVVPSNVKSSNGTSASNKPASAATTQPLKPAVPKTPTASTPSTAKAVAPAAPASAVVQQVKPPVTTSATLQPVTTEAPNSATPATTEPSKTEGTPTIAAESKQPANEAAPPSTTEATKTE